MHKQSQYRRICAKADQYFTRKNYALAKEEYASALLLASDDRISARIRACEQQLAQQRKEQIKKGRRLEKKGNFSAALDCFSQALQSEHEVWLEKKVEQLGRRQQQGQVHAQIEQIQQLAETATLVERLAACNNALELGQDDYLRREKLACLVQLGRYAEAVDLFEERAVDDDQGLYDYAYALIADGHYCQGLSIWVTLLSVHPALRPQIEACLPGLAGELTSGGGNYASVHRLLTNVPAAERTQVLQSYQRYFGCLHIEELWHAQDHTGIAELLSTLPEPLTPPRLGLLAKLYFSLTENDVHWLEPAISYWLTAIYNQDLLQSLKIHGAAFDAPDNRSLRAGLLQLMQERIDEHARAGRISPEMQAHWQSERRQIERLAALPVDSGGLAVFPCTPAFARKFELSGPILELLRAQRTSLGLDDPSWLELSAHYSSLGNYLVRIEAGSEDRVFNALAPAGTDPLSNYLRQCIAMGCGISRVRSGERQTQKFFQAALPLLKGNPQFRRQLIDLAYTEPAEKILSSLAEAMEFLSRHLPQQDFLEAAAHCIAGDAETLQQQGVNLANVEKRLKRALAIHANSHRAKLLLTEVRREQVAYQIDKALGGGNANKAAHIARNSADPEIKGFFFDRMDQLRQDVTPWGRTRQISFLKSIYGNCRSIDAEHPTTLKIAADLKRLEVD